MEDYRRANGSVVLTTHTVSAGTCFNLCLPSYVDPILSFQVAVPGRTAEEKPPSDTSGNHDGIHEVSKDAVVLKKVQLTAIPYFIYLNAKPDKQPQPRLDPGFTFSSLNSSHIDLLDETWHYGGSEHSRKYLANMVRCFPSTCILDSNGHPISWIITESWGAAAHSYTLPSHRQRGYSSMVQREHGMRVHAAGFPVYGHVALDNTPQHKLMDSLGFQRLSELCHYCIHSPASQ
ncbi:N-acyltransferase 3 [Podarcis lilfordi]|uniref:Glycine N-acyltransferase-like protein n=1 Tax=Podarcis lilfordi TaxID=74358 RepID=A0AA35NVS6_9SAUR|nr:N-acyltransferase 3 [Podarcis lilfordi]